MPAELIVSIEFPPGNSVEVPVVEVPVPVTD